MSHTFTITVTDAEYKGLQSAAMSPQEWVEIAVTNQARVENDTIIQNLIDHCNANNIALAVGRDAQIEQAFALGLAKTAQQRQEEYDAEWAQQAEATEEETPSE